MKELNFDDLEDREVKINVKGASYVLVEPNAEAGTWRRNKLIESTELITETDEAGEISVKPGKINLANNFELEYLSMCIFPIECRDGVTLERSKQHVDVSIVRGWPDRIVSTLLDTLREMGEQGKEADPTQEPNDEPIPGVMS